MISTVLHEHMILANTILRFLHSFMKNIIFNEFKCCWSRNTFLFCSSIYVCRIMLLKSVKHKFTETPLLKHKHSFVSLHCCCTLNNYQYYVCKFINYVRPKIATNPWEKNVNVLILYFLFIFHYIIFHQNNYRMWYRL